MLDKRAAAKASAFLNEYSIEKGIYMKINYFNADHTHALIDLPTRYSIEEVIKLFKGGSSYWINHSQIIKGKFAWGGGYGAFRCHTLMLHGLLAISPTRKTIASGRMRKNTSCLLSGMVWNGALRKTIEMVVGQCRRP
jgi:hypothetical protein